VFSLQAELKGGQFTKSNSKAYNAPTVEASEKCQKEQSLLTKQEGMME
jgi:hypothetical protein